MFWNKVIYAWKVGIYTFSVIFIADHFNQTNESKEEKLNMQ